ncbi:MAG: hypothetical protein ACT4O0_03200 [Pseudonocardia sp.]
MPPEIQKSYLLWMSVVALALVNVILNLIRAGVDGSGGTGSAFVMLLLAAVLAYGAAYVRLGYPWARVLNTVMAAIVGMILLTVILSLFGLIVFYVIAVAAGFPDGGLVVSFFLVGLVVALMIGLLVALGMATVSMYKQPASQYLAPSR